MNTGDAASLDPVLTQETAPPSPSDEQTARAELARGIKARLSNQIGPEPTERQQTQSEILDLELRRFRGMDPFSVRHIPFEQLREMTTDQMLGFGWQMTMAPLVRADYYFESPDAQIAAAVDEAFRPIATATYLAYSNDLWYGHQPLVKRFKLGRLGATYNDSNGADPTADLPVWTSSADALLWKEPLALNPSHCLPVWNDDGEMIGFKFSSLPIPNFDLISAASSYGYENIPGKDINSDYAMWSVNEQELNFGSIYGSPRTKRAYRFWWCNPPETPILMSDYTLRPLGSIVEGDEIIGWEPKMGRRASGLYAPRVCLTKTIVTAVSRRPAQKMVKVTFESGHVIRCTPNHVWNLAGTAQNNVRPGRDSEWGVVEVGREISRVIDLHAGDRPFIYEALDEEQQIAANWLGGLYDGEGSGAYIGQSESHNAPVRERMAESLDLLGFSYTCNPDSFWIKGGREELMRFARLTRPTRVRAMDRLIIDNNSASGGGFRFRRPDKIVSIEPDGEDMAIGLTTTTGNYVAWGLASKNSYWYRWALADRAFENTVDPTKIVYFPTEIDEFLDPDADPESVVQRMRDRALRVGESARSGATVALPGDYVEGPDGRPTTARKWQLSYLEGQQHFADLDASFNHLEILKLRAWMVPEQAFLEGHGGSSSRLVATQLGEVYQESQQLLADRYDRQTNEDMVRQFIEVNFPDRAGTPCRKVTKGLGAIDAQILQQVLTLVGQVRGNFLPVNMRKLLEQMGLPLLSKKEWEQEMKDISKLASISGASAPGGPFGGAPPAGPSPTEPTKRGTQGYNAGVERTATGEARYFQPRQRIVLADSDGFMNSLPDTPHYTDVGVRSAIVRLRRLLVDRYGEQYDSLASYLESQPALFLAAEAPTQAAPAQLSQQDAQRVSTRLIEAWAAVHAAGVVGSPIEAMGDAASVPAKMGGLLAKIALAGGAGTLKGARLDAEDFGAGVLQPWVAQRVGTSLNSIDDTVRTEAQGWLEGQLQESIDPTAVAAAAREHFADFAQTHADRVARTEGVVAYNRGSLTALHLAGVAQVQAHDASDGTDHLTDKECQQRNGKIYSVEDAMNVQEHPNGSLFWVPLTTEKLSVVRVDAIPAELNGHGESVAYDERTETLYLLSDVDEDQERVLLHILGDQIAYR